MNKHVCGSSCWTPAPTLSVAWNQPKKLFECLACFSVPLFSCFFDFVGDAGADDDVGVPVGVVGGRSLQQKGLNSIKMVYSNTQYLRQRSTRRKTY